VLSGSTRPERPIPTRGSAARAARRDTDSRSTVVSDRANLHQLLGDDLAASGDEEVIFSAPDMDVEAVLSSSWNITLVGTVPSAAGAGLATKLINLVLDRSRDGRGIWVPTTFEPRVGVEPRAG